MPFFSLEMEGNPEHRCSYAYLWSGVSLRVSMLVQCLHAVSCSPSLLPRLLYVSLGMEERCKMAKCENGMRPAALLLNSSGNSLFKEHP